jgi:diadenosine tetraphosphate (Ap4A) HIT family hydrolase
VDCPYCTIPRARIWIESDSAIAFAADEAAADGHIIVVPLAHVSSIYAMSIESQTDLWALVSEVRGRLRVGLVTEGGFSIGCLDGLTAATSVPHAVIHIIPRGISDQVSLPECSEWIDDDGMLDSATGGQKEKKAAAKPRAKPKT